MSRIGKQLIKIPAQTEVAFADGVFSVKGPKGSLQKNFNDSIAIKIAGEEITLEPVKNTLQARALWGTYASHIINMIEGVNNLYVKKLILEGIGYKMEVAGTSLKMALGFSHPVNVEIPTGITVVIEKSVMTITGADKETVGQFAAKIRDLKKPEPYKGKGFRYDGEVIKRKQGKKTA
jgi:large subunit ribosomal protein L6